MKLFSNIVTFLIVFFLYQTTFADWRVLGSSANQHYTYTLTHVTNEPGSGDAVPGFLYETYSDLDNEYTHRPVFFPENTFLEQADLSAKKTLNNEIENYKSLLSEKVKRKDKQKNKLDKVTISITTKNQLLEQPNISDKAKDLLKVQINELKIEQLELEKNIIELDSQIAEFNYSISDVEKQLSHLPARLIEIKKEIFSSAVYTYTDQDPQYKFLLQNELLYYLDKIRYYGIYVALNSEVQMLFEFYGGIWMELNLKNFKSRQGAEKVAAAFQKKFPNTNYTIRESDNHPSRHDLYLEHPRAKTGIWDLRQVEGGFGMKKQVYLSFKDEGYSEISEVKTGGYISDGWAYK